MVANIDLSTYSSQENITQVHLTGINSIFFFTFTTETKPKIEMYKLN